MKNSPFQMKTSSLSSKPHSDIYANASFTPNDDDSVERMTVLGSQLPNPYLIPNMRQAYLDLGYDPARAVVNNLYVRFLPTTSQLASLDSVMDSQGYELFDTPMDYEVISEGDYYQDPSIPDSLPTWQYAVVAPGFVSPSGITYQVLAQIHIPPDDFTAIETEAESIVGGGGDPPTLPNNVNPNVLQCGQGYHWDFTLKRCVPNSCPSGYHWDNGQQECVPNDTCPVGFYWNAVDGFCEPYNTNPPPPASDAAIPAGYIKVHDTNLNSDVPVWKARIVARRWFKVDRVYTDNNGRFVSNKKFKHKVRINIKFKNDDAQIRNIRGIRFWQMFFPVKKTLGIYSGDKSSINYTFIQYPDYSAKGNMYWTAATVHNGVQEYRDFAPIQQIGLPPQKLIIFISKAALVGSGGGTPMFNKRLNFSLSTQFVLVRLSSLASIVNNIIAILKGQVDMVIGYRYSSAGTPDINLLVSDEVKENIYHELTHAAQYAALGNSWYSSFAGAVETEIVSNMSSGYLPYGDGSNSSSPIVALGEGWAYYMGHYLADKKYGTNSSCQNEQDDLPGSTWCNYSGTGHPHLDVEENFNPHLTADRFEWIPQGLFYDLWDITNEAGTPVLDQVSGYTNQQMFNAFQSNIYTLQDYRVRLLQTTTNSTSSFVPNLFFQYGY